GDLDAESRSLRVRRTIDGKGRVGTLKRGHARDLDLSRESVAVLRTRAAARLEGGGGGGRGCWGVQKAGGWGFKREATGGGRPDHFSPHSLRHTFATLHINAGVTPAWLQAQMGHSSLTVTLDVYSRWWRLRDLEAADRLDRLVVSETSLLVSGDA